MAEKEALHTKVDRRSQWPGAAARRHVRTSRPYYAHQPVVERQRSAEPPALSGRRQDLSPCSGGFAIGLAVDELPGGNHRRGRAGATPGGGAYGAYRCATNGGGGWGPGHTGNVGARIRRDLSLRKGSAREPQRLPRRRFLLSTPRIVASLMVAPASLAVRCFRPPVACDDRPATTLTADDVRWIPTRSATPSTALVPQRKVGFPIPNAGLLLGFQGTKTARRGGISSPFSDAGGCTSPQNSGFWLTTRWSLIHLKKPISFLRGGSGCRRGSRSRLLCFGLQRCERC